MASPFFTAEQLHGRLSHQPPAAVSEFLNSHNWPMQDSSSERVTFAWHQASGSSTPDSSHVLMRMNRISDKTNLTRGLMENVAGTSLWVLTLDLPATLRASYGFSAINGPIPQTTPPPGQGPSVLPDPLNPSSCNGWSVYAGPSAAPQPDWENSDWENSDWENSGWQGSGWQGFGSAPAGRHGTKALRFADHKRKCHFYLPNHEYCQATNQPLRLLVLTDADVWFDGLDLPGALDRAIHRGYLPPLAVVGAVSTSPRDRREHLAGNSNFFADLAHALPRQAVAWADQSGVGVTTGSMVFAGQSLGGLSGLQLLMEEPEVFGAIISQSPSLWWTPGEESAPATWSDRQVDWVTEKIEQLPVGREKILLSVGQQEGFSVERVERLAQVLKHRGWRSSFSIYDGGHDYAWWRGALFDALRAVLI
ncbi:alpha/beta hydrolase-fold protein [Corynebacterium cystitidis]|uniref:Enterochelin esterase n=1 Tax=Corynebacterium cystitidis DSM 20524 TaxID=1121357 RepID=A0A1H9VTN4_9CORY|nr:alpha/beta hydrolase-fold protein [Corynebacterium cystitidis]WJY81089.1 Enterochelin esterase [Corynebacterium cystitidis DSM 20524]SES24891.1 Enterochelin esterase [Corynebacterium cystitidis DSM 20524]SNV90056.1 enterochelin esterase [Corynebacterium cystitidis]